MSKKDERKVVSEGNGGSMQIPPGIVPPDRVPEPELAEIPDILSELNAVRKESQQAEEQAPAVAERLKKDLPQVDAWEAANPAERERLKRRLPGIEEKVGKTKQDLERLLYDQDTPPEIRKTAWLAVLKHRFSQVLTSRREVMALLNSLAERNLLLPNKKGVGKIRARNVTYDVPETALFGEKEAREVQEKLDSLVEAAGERERTAWQEETKRLQGMGDLSIQEMLQFTPGRTFLYAPKEEKSNGGWLSSASFVAESDGEEIHLLADPDSDNKEAAAIGAEKAKLTQAMRQGFRFPIASLSLGEFPEKQMPPHFQKYLDGLKKQKRWTALPNRDDRLEEQLNQWKKLQRLRHDVWDLFARGVKHGLAKEEAAKQSALEKEQIAAGRKAMEDKATITAQEFFLQGEKGISVVSHEGTWRDERGDRTFSSLFLLVERKGGDTGEDVIRLREVPSHIPADFLAGCEEEYPEGERFAGVRQPLQSVLKAVYGQTIKAEKIRQGQTAETGQPPADHQ